MGSVSAPELRLGRWEEVLADVQAVDAILVDAPYSERTHRGHDAAVASTDDERRSLNYAPWSEAHVRSFVTSWAPRCRGWIVSLTDSTLAPVWRAELERHGLTAFGSVVALIPGMSVRLTGDGPSSWAINIVVARPPALVRWGTLPGGYSGKPERGHIGGKPLWLMRALVRDYSRPGDLVVDPCAGGATTLLAAAVEGRRAIGAEMDPVTYQTAQARLACGYTPDLLAGLG